MTEAEYEILPGLRGHGPLPEQFSATGRGTHSEGLVVEFFPVGGDSWVGNLQGGFGKCHGVFHHPDGNHFVVVAQGQAYVVNPQTRELVEEFGADLEQAIEVPDLSILVLTDGTYFEALGRGDGDSWRSERVSWDGIRSLSRVGPSLEGEAFSPIDDSWQRFSLDLRTGKHSGGSWDGTQFHAI